MHWKERLKESVKKRTENLNVDSILGAENISNFYLTCFSENLNHARHVENERLTFNSIYMVTVGGFMAFFSQIDFHDMHLLILSIFINVFMLFIGVLGILLSLRWESAFKAHLKSAEDNHKILCDELPENSNKPKYCFSIPKNGNDSNCCIIKCLLGMRTSQLFHQFYFWIEFMFSVLLVFQVYRFFRYK